jgi:hypothetical protein
MEYKYEYICKIKQPVLCELCNKSYALGVMKKHKQTKMHIENAVPSSWWFVSGTKPDAFPSLVSLNPSVCCTLKRASASFSAMTVECMDV